MKIWRNEEKGYTLVEMLTVVSVFGVLALASSNLFFSSMVGSSKEAALRQIKQNGEFTVVQLESALRGADALLPNTEEEVCGVGMDSIVYRSSDGRVREIGVDTYSGAIYVKDPEVPDNREVDVLTAEGLRVVTDSEYPYHPDYPRDGSQGEHMGGADLVPFAINCQRDEGSGTTLVEVEFSLYKGDYDDKPEERYAEGFRAQANLRNRQ